MRLLIDTHALLWWLTTESSVWSYADSPGPGGEHPGPQQWRRVWCVQHTAALV